jgi:hypothetical protein
MTEAEVDPLALDIDGEPELATEVRHDEDAAWAAARETENAAIARANDAHNARWLRSMSVAGRRRGCITGSSRSSGEKRHRRTSGGPLRADLHPLRARVWAAQDWCGRLASDTEEQPLRRIAKPRSPLRRVGPITRTAHELGASIWGAD